MRVGDERGEDCCLWAERGANGWKGTEGEGPHFKVQDQSVGCHLQSPHTETHSFSVHLENEFIK